MLQHVILADHTTRIESRGSVNMFALGWESSCRDFNTYRFREDAVSIWTMEANGLLRTVLSKVWTLVFY